MRSLLRVFLFSFQISLLSFAMATAAAAQNVEITGTVTDASGAVLPGTTIDATIAGLSVATTVTESDGRYRLALAPHTQHQLRARLHGFADAAADLRTTAASATHDFMLRIAAVADAIIVTAARVPEHRSAVNESIAVLTAADIQALGSTSLVDVLRVLPGLNVESTGREGALSSLFARGGESDYNLVLIDGVRVNPSGGAYDFSRVSASEIDRLEVVRGGHSALYGSDAIASVVQVITRRAAPGDAPRIIASTEAGSFDTWRGDASLLGGAQRRFDYQLGAVFRNTHGAFQDILPDDDTFRQTSWGGGHRRDSRRSRHARTGARYANAKGKAIGQIDFGSRDTGTAADTRDLSWHLDASHRLSDRVDQSAHVSYFESSRLSAEHDCRSDVPRLRDPGRHTRCAVPGQPAPGAAARPAVVRGVPGRPPAADRRRVSRHDEFGVSDFTSTSRSEFRRPALRYQANATWGGSQLLSGGYDYEHESDPLNPSFLVDNHALFVQQRFAVRDRWLATVGVRVDRNSRYGNNASPKLSLGGFVVPYRQARVSSLKVFSNIGRGIKNPQFGELYSTAFTDGDPNLRPERARTIDVGAEVMFASQRVLARATYFDNAFNDQVAFKSTGRASMAGRTTSTSTVRRQRVGAGSHAAAPDRRVHGKRRLRAGRHQGRRVRQHQRAIPAGAAARCGGRSTRPCCAPATRAAARRSTSTSATSASATTRRSSACRPCRRRSSRPDGRWTSR